MIRNLFLEKSNFSDQGLLLACAKAKDASTLSRVLQFDQEGDDRTNDFDNRENPLVAASLTDHVECVRLLYNAGFRIRLGEEDSRAVNSSFEVHESSLCTRMSSLFNDDEEQQTLDPVVRFLKFKAFTKPHYLTLDTLRDKKLQIKRVFRLGEHAKILAESFPEHSVEYLLLREDLKKYARDLLDECSNSREVEELLEDTGGGGQGRRDSLFDEALHKEQKPFVAHAYFQHMLRKCLEVGMGYNSRSHFIKGILPQKILTPKPHILDSNGVW